MPPERAADLLGDAKLHAYLGPETALPGRRAVFGPRRRVARQLRDRPDQPRAYRHRTSGPHARSSRRFFGTWPAKTGSCSIPTRSPPSTAIISTMSIEPRPRRRGCSARRPPRRRASCWSGRTVCGKSRSPGMAREGIGLGCRSRGDRCGGVGGRLDDVGQWVARAALDQERVVSRRAHSGRRDRRCRSGTSHRGDGAALRDRGLS